MNAYPGGPRRIRRTNGGSDRPILDAQAGDTTEAAEVKTIFEPWQLAEYLETARQSEPFEPELFDEEHDPEIVEMERQDDIRRSARDLLLVEHAKGWLLGEEGTSPTDEPS